MTTPDPTPSRRRRELLDLAYGYVLEHGISDLSLRPLAAAIGSSPRVLLFLFGSKDGLVRALLGRARQDELAMLAELRADVGDRPPGLAAAARQVWQWLSAQRHRTLLTLWTEGYARSLVDPDGPWAGFARATVDDWLDVLAAAQPPAQRRSAAGRAARTLVLALLRGALLDLLATADSRRVSAAVKLQIDALADTESPDAVAVQPRV
jgi:AcrR family transcriptional regulator